MYSAASKGMVFFFGISDLLGQFPGALDIALLRGLVATAKKDDQFGSALHEIDSLARTEVDPKFADAIEECDIAQQAGLNAHDPLGDLFLRNAIAKSVEPSLEIGV